MIQIDRLTKAYTRRARVLDQLSCAIPRGQAVAIWGSNGAGKTTLIRCLLGLIDYTGTIEVEGLDVRRHGKAVRRRIGYVPQEMAFYDEFRLSEAMRFVARLRGANRASCDAHLEDVGLSAHARKRVRELSGGMKQRLALALAMLNDPPVLVLDEPTSNLDTAGRRDLFELLIGLKQGGKTIVFISHRNEEVAGLADRVLTLEHGTILRDELLADAPDRTELATVIPGGRT